jgi:hypothetical protein
MPSTLRVIAYIDGFNLFFGMKEKGWRRYYWLNPEALVRMFLGNRELRRVKYFTAQITSPLDKMARQKAYLDALATLPLTTTMMGRYEMRPWTCFGCQKVTPIPKEKMSDVRLATELLVDGFYDNFDVAFVITGDADIVPPIEYVRRLFPDKQIGVLFPPKRVSDELKQVASWTSVIGRANIAASQFPDIVIRSSGHPLHRPDKWR